jgi:hypothetical protein
VLFLAAEGTDYLTGSIIDANGASICGVEIPFP